MKMRQKWLVGLFAILALIQLGAPASLIVDREAVLRTGRQFKFKVAPIDPYDAFRGRYVDLGFDRTEAPNPSGISVRSGEKIFAVLTEDADGFATIERISTERPPGNSYITARARWTWQGRVYLNLPFNRYYLDEEAAPATERALAGRRGQRKEAYITVRVKAGQTVLEELYLDGEPVRKLIREGRL